MSKKLINLDPIILMMLENEADIFHTSSSAIVRVAILEYLCRSHQSRMPVFFEDEKMISDFQTKVREIYILCKNEEGMTPFISSLNMDGKKLYQECYARMLCILEEERRKFKQQ
jgi:hypothetical protein